MACKVMPGSRSEMQSHASESGTIAMTLGARVVGQCAATNASLSKPSRLLFIRTTIGCPSATAAYAWDSSPSSSRHSASRRENPAVSKAAMAVGDISGFMVLRRRRVLVRSRGDHPSPAVLAEPFLIAHPRQLHTPISAENARSTFENADWRRGRDSNPRYSLRPYDALAKRCLQPLGHLSGGADMPERTPTRKRQIQIATRSFGGSFVAGSFGRSSRPL